MVLDRRLAAVWFADIVGFTALADGDEDAALEAIGLAEVPLPAGEPVR